MVMRGIVVIIQKNYLIIGTKMVTTMGRKKHQVPTLDAHQLLTQIFYILTHFMQYSV